MVAVTDIDPARAQKIAKGLGGRAEATGQDLIAAKDVDAIIVTSIGSTHEEFVLASIAAKTNSSWVEPMEVTMIASTSFAAMRYCPVASARAPRPLAIF